jgi:hypothetical protein
VRDEFNEYIKGHDSKALCSAFRSRRPTGRSPQMRARTGRPRPDRGAVSILGLDPFRDVYRGAGPSATRTTRPRQQTERHVRCRALSWCLAGCQCESNVRLACRANVTRIGQPRRRPEPSLFFAVPGLDQFRSAALWSASSSRRSRERWSLEGWALSILKYEVALKSNKVVLVFRGTRDEVAKAREVTQATKASEVELHEPEADAA